MVLKWLLDLRVMLALALLVVSAYAYTQHQEAKHQESEKRIARLELDIATSANQTANDLLARMTAERDGLLLKRAAEQKAAEEAVAESQQIAVQVFNELVAAKRQINAMTLHQGCKPILTAQICPEVADALRVP